MTHDTHGEGPINPLQSDPLILALTCVTHRGTHENPITENQRSIVCGFSWSNSRVPPEEVIAMSRIYVDDFLTAGPTFVVNSFLATKDVETSCRQYVKMKNHFTRPFG